MPVGANAAVSGLNVNVGVNLTQFNTGMNEVEKRGQQVASTLNKVGSNLGTGAAIGAGFAVATTALTALSGAATGAVGAVVGLSSQLEQARIGFTAFTKDADKANNFIKQLQQFAATTTFEFPGLLQAARQLTGMGVQAELVIPILKDVAGAVMAVGGGDTEIRRVNTALTQMMAAGKVNAQDMMQLANAGIPAWKMLADSMGMTIGQVRKLSEQGQISSQQMLQAFHNFVQNNGLADMAEKAGQTWQAATSNIKDGLLIIATEGFAPLFEVIRNAAVALANFLTSDSAKQFAQDLKATIQDLVNAAAPLGDALGRAFEAFKTGGVSGAFSSILTDVQNLARSMGGAGYDVVAEFVSGIMSGAASLVTEAANFVADTIAQYLIGSSPPPVGPLSNIVQGGANVIAAYVEGLRSGVGDVAGVAQGVADALGNVNKTLTFEQGLAALKAAGTDMKALQRASEDAEGVLRNLDGLIRDNQSALRDYRNAADDIKTAYDAAVEPLQRQVDALKEVNDLSQKQADIQTKLQLAQLKGALNTAQGDPVQRARLQTQLDVLEQQEKELTLQERSLSLNAQASQLAAKARGEKVTDVGQSQRQNQLAQQRLQLQQQQNAIQIQLEGMVNKEAVARIKSQQAQVQAVKNQRDINEEVAQLNRELQAAPLEAQIKDLRAQEQALLQPIQQRIEAAQREGQALQEQRQVWQGLKGDIADVMQQQRALAAEAKASATAANKAAKEAALANPMDLTQIFKPEAITAQATKVGESFVSGFNSWLQANGPKLIGGAVGAMLGSAAFGPLGAIAGAAFGSQFVARMQTHFGSLEEIGGKVAGKISDALNVDTGKANNAIEAFGIIWETVQGRIHIAIEQIIIDVARILNIDVSSGATVVDRLGIIWDTLKTRIATAITDAATEIGKLTGIDVSAASGPVDAIATLWDGLSTRVQGYITTAVEFIKTQWQSAVDAVNSATFNENLKIIIGNLNTAFGILKTIANEASIAILGLDFSGIETGAGTSATKVTDLGTAILGLTKTLSSFTTAAVNILDFFATLGSALDHLQMMLNNTGLMLNKLMLAIGHLVTGDVAAAKEDMLGFEAVRKKAHEGQDGIIKDISDFINRVKERSNAAGQAAETVGTEIGAQLTAAVRDSIPEVEQASTDLADSAVRGVSAALQTGSPSQAMTEQGTFAGEGLALGIAQSSVLVVQAVDDTVSQMQLHYLIGFNTIHENTTVQLDAIYTLIQDKGTDMVGVVTNIMTDMLKEVTTGLSAIHTQMTVQFAEIHALVMQSGTAVTGAVKLMMDNSLTVVMGEQERWRAAGFALGTSLAEGMASAQLNVQRSGMSLMGNVVGGSKANPQLQETINAAARKYALDPRLFTAQLQHESAGFDPNVISGARRGGAGEIGLGQFMPATLSTMLQRNGLSLQQYLGDAKVQVELAAQHMAELVKTFGDYDKALQAYNGGPGGVGSAATTRYAQIVHQVADTLKQETSGSQLMSLSAGRMNLGIDQITAGRNAGLSLDEARAICGPYAAVLFAQATGRNPSLAEAKELGAAVGWTAARGMGGTGNFMALLGRMGIDAVRQAATPQNVNAALAAGNPIALSTPKHYFVGAGGTAESGINVGATGTVMGGKPTMTLAEITALGGGMNDLIVLTSRLKDTGTQTFQDLTRVSGQFGTAVVTSTDAVTGDIETVAATGADANQKLTVSTQTLATSIQSGIVPAGLAARDAVGQMAVGIQPLIAAWANGQMTSAQLAESIVQIAAQSGLAAQPLAAFAAGNMSVGEALRQVMVSMAQTDPAFAAIQSQIQGTQLSTEQLADVLLRGLANVTGSVGISLQQMSTSITPLQTAFASGAVSGEQFVASVVELAATSGFTQAPLRLMQDGVIGANEALGQVMQTVAETNPSIAEMGTTLAELPAPATEAATAFLDWIKSMQETEAATQVATAAVELVPEAVTDIQAPMETASVDAMQTLPIATTEALDQTVEAIRNISSSAADAAREVGEAIVTSLKEAVESGAEDIAQSAMAIVEKALEAAKKAADKVKDSVKKGGGGDDTDEKAKGGRLTPGIWTLVGENGPELISPNGYVYTAGETAQMLADSVSSGMFTLESFATGGKSKTKKSKSKKSSDSSSDSNAAPKTVRTPDYREELDLQQQILDITYNRDRLLATQIVPLEEKLRVTLRDQAAALKGSEQDQWKLAAMKQQTLNIDLQITKLRYEDRPLYDSMFKIEGKLTDLQYQQSEAAKGDLLTRSKLAAFDMQRLQGEQQIADLQLQAMPARNELADIEQRIADIQRGSIADQMQVQSLQAQQTRNNLESNLLQAQAAQYDKEILAAQNALLPVTQAIRKVQASIEKIQRGTLDDQYRAIDLETEQARLRLQEMAAQGKLRDVAAGTLKMSQTEINTLHRQLEIIENQKAQLSDQTEERQLQGVIASVDGRKQLVSLQEQERQHTAIIDDVTDQRTVLQAQITDLQQQNAVLDLQVQNIQLQNTIRADALGSQLLNLQNQVLQYDQVIARVQRENDMVQAQSALLNANNAVAAAGYNAQIVMLQDILDRRQREIDSLNRQKELIQGQTDLITTQNQIAAAGYAGSIISLETLKGAQTTILENLNAQLGTLNAQKKIYEDIRNLADAIANRPPNPSPAPVPGTPPTSGPPGTVAATASKEGEPTLYLSRGGGIDGWYTSDGRMVVQGGTASPPSGYRVKWLASGGLWRAGEVAVLGEEGPEIAIAPKDLYVFSHSQSKRVASSFGRATAPDEENMSNVTVQVEYHRHGGTDYGEGTLQQVVREAVAVAMRS